MRFVDPLPGTTANYWLNAIVLDSEADRDALLEYTNSRDVMTRPIWRLMSRLPMFQHCQHDGLESSRWLEARVGGEFAVERAGERVPPPEGLIGIRL